MNKHLSFLTKKSTEELISAKRQYFLVLYSVSWLVILYYLYRFNFHHGTSDFNLGFAFSGALMVGSGLVLHYFKNYIVSVSIFFVAIAFLCGLLTFGTGGFDAPGAIWVIGIPIFGAILGSRKGLVLGVGLVLTIFGVFAIDDYYLHGDKMLLSTMDFPKEKRLNLILFFVIIMPTLYYFVKKEEDRIHKIHRQKEEIDLLLKVLVHDIANPMMFADMKAKKLAKKEELKDDKDLARLNVMISTMMNVLKAVRAVETLKDGKFEVLFKPTDMKASLKQCIEIYKDRIEDKDLTIKYDWDENEEFLVNSEPTILVSQVLANFVSNAIKFSYKGGTLNFRLYKGVDGQVSLTLRDHGQGMSSEKLQEIFQMGSKTSTEGTAGEKGTGYGMPLAKAFAERLGAEIEVISQEKDESSDSHGTEVNIKWAA